MARYPTLVQIAWDAVDAFLGDWQKLPLKWGNEVDVQAELASRLDQAYRLIGKDLVYGNYPKIEKHLKDKQVYRRVMCEPKMVLRNGRRAYPDIVVWEDIGDIDRPPDVDGARNWPVLWACEIKYRYSGGEDEDIGKLSRFVRQGDFKYGCWLHLSTAKAKSGKGISCDRVLRGDRLWKYEARLP